MAALTGRAVCWEYSIPLETFPTVKNIYREITDEISFLTQKLQKTDPPARNIPDKLLKVQSKLKLLVFSEDEEQVTNFLSWTRFHPSECRLCSETDRIKETVLHAQREDILVIPIILVTENDIEKKVVRNQKQYNNYLDFFPLRINNIDARIDIYFLTYFHSKLHK
jgi:hypothetical protein